MHKLLSKQFSFNQLNFYIEGQGNQVNSPRSDAKSGFHFPLLLTWKPVEQTAYMIQNI